MSRIKTFLIGRYPDCDLVLNDRSVSRRHAEVVLAPDARYYIIDRGSSGGTFVNRGSGWREISRDFVNATDHLRFGNHEIPASCLADLHVLPDVGGGEGRNSGDGLDSSRPLIRNPKSGSVVEKS